MTASCEGMRFVDGVLFSSLTSDELLKAIRKLEIRDDDVFVMTYPRAGTTWTQEIVSILFHGCDIEKADKKTIRQRFLFLDMQPLDSSVGPHEIAAGLPSPRLLKTHLQSNQMPEQLITSKAKIVVVARNPKDNAVSLFHFCNAIVSEENQLTWDGFFTDFCEEKVIMGGWFKMNTYWWSRRHEGNVLFLKYEDMQNDLAAVILKISEFFDWPIPDGKLDDIVNHCTFGSMKSNPKTNYSDSPSFKDVTSKPFVRKGKVGDWKNYFTVAQNEAFDKLYEEKMKNTGLVFDYELYRNSSDDELL